jgi:hypothetical protein
MSVLYLVNLLFYPEDGANTFLENVGKLRTTWRHIQEALVFRHGHDNLNSATSLVYYY